MALAQQHAARKPKRMDPAAEARNAFFVRSDLDSTLELTDAALQAHPSDPELLFLRMEAAALKLDAPTTLDAAIRLCAAASGGLDPRGIIAASRIRELAANSSQFRTVVPRLRQLIAAGSPYSHDLRSALIAAAADGTRGLNLLSLARDAGLITDWNVGGPFGKYPNVAFEQSWPPEHDSLPAKSPSPLPVERLRTTDDGFDLPAYFPRTGVFYAAATLKVSEAGRHTLRVDSDGTLETFVDGRSVLRKDSRFRSGPGAELSDVNLAPGVHTLLVKFIPSAVPFQVALLPSRPPAEQKLAGDPTELAYISAARHYWAGRYAEAATGLQALFNSRPSAAVDVLLANTWERATDDSPEESNYLLSALKASQQTAAADFRLAQKALSAGRTEEAWQRASRVAQDRPDFFPAQEIVARIASARDWTVETIAAIDAILRIHPSCAAIEDAYRFYNGHAQFGRASDLLNRLSGCAPGSTAYISALSDAGDHDKAVRAAAKMLLSDPLSRQLRYLEVKELALAGRTAEALEAAQQLAALAPNSSYYRRLASSGEDLLALLQQPGPQSRALLGDHPFYEPYRRDPTAIIRQSAANTSPAPAITLLEDKVSCLNDDGSVSVYFHRVVKVLTRAGIENFGEVTLPRGADVLELRTLKQDGSIAEPEFHEHKVSLSMPALSPGDSIEQEYVVNYDDKSGIGGHATEFTFTFGWYRRRIASMRFVAITPVAEEVTTQELNGAPKATVSAKGGRRFQVWEQDGIPDYPEENSVPARDLLPTVKVLSIPADGWAGVRDYYRDQLIDATRVGPRTEATLANLHVEGTEYDRLKALYAFVVSRIRSDQSSVYPGNLTCAEDTLASNVGSRTASLVALARAAGLSADVVLTHQLNGLSAVMAESAFTRPLVQFNLSGSPTILDVESDNMGFGNISALLDRREALAVPMLPHGSARTLISLDIHQSEQSTAEGILRIGPQGGLDARLTLRLGASRSAQMRTMLAGIDPGGRPQFLRDLAERIFPGARDTTGEILNERELDRPLEVVLHCRSSQFPDLAGTPLELEQFVPGLGLRQLYAIADSRRFPLLIDTPLVERTSFRIELPANVHLARRINTVDIRNDFGRYRVSARELNAGSFEITRDFDIPVQVIAPARYPEFRLFATQIDEAERQRFVLSVSSTSSAHTPETYPTNSPTSRNAPDTPFREASSAKRSAMRCTVEKICAPREM
jgi:tetratricopeptide (TPR) repeat protein